MAICQCLKANGQPCEREASKKKGDNPLFCWQHQKCTNLKVTEKIPIKSKTNLIPIKSKMIYTLLGFKIDGDYLPNSTAFVISISSDLQALKKQMFSLALPKFEAMLDSAIDIEIPEEVRTEDIKIYRNQIIKEITNNPNQDIIFGIPGEHSVNGNYHIMGCLFVKIKRIM